MRTSVASRATMGIKRMLLIAASCAAITAAARADESVTCQPMETMGDYQILSCDLPKRAAGQHFRFRAMFSGGHDDTVASLVSTRLDGQPLVCAPGSKTRLEGEDGDVSLECRFDVAAQGAATNFEVQVRWSHAQYEGHALTRK
jgi:hypothetical protein